VAKRLFQTIMDSAIKLDGPMGETLTLLEGFRSSLEQQLNSLGLDTLPIFKEQPVEGEWGEDD